MKFKWRITKYNPKYRDQNGIYNKDEWTSIYDIGSIHDNKKLTVKEYLDIEDKYIFAIENIVNCNKIPHLTVSGLEKWEEQLEIEEFPDLYNANMYNLYENISEESLVHQKDVGDLSRLILRNNLWCRLNHPRMYLHFGHDFYMFIGCEMECVKLRNNIQSSGLFIEDWISPIKDG